MQVLHVSVVLFLSISATHIFLVCLDNKFISNTEQPKELKQY